MPKEPTSQVQMIEYLNATAATTPDCGTIAWLTIRQETGQWEVSNVGLTPVQAWRLMNDLRRLFTNVPQLQEALKEQQQAGAIVAEEIPFPKQNPPKRRRPGRRRK